MPATLRAPKAEPRLAAVVPRPRGGMAAEDRSVPRFALIATPPPDPRAMLLSPIILATVLISFVALGRLPHAAPAHLADDVTMLVPPPEPLTLPDLSAARVRSELPVPPQSLGEPTKIDPPAPKLAEFKPAPRKAEAVTSHLVAAKPVPPEMEEKPAQIPSLPEHSANATAPTPATVPPPKPEPAIIAARSVNTADGQGPKQEPAAANPARDGLIQRAPSSLGGLPLSQLIAEQDGLAAGLAALPSRERLGLPRVSIRVNAEWVAALPRTQERLYFSITAPQTDREVLAYLPESHSFDLERPERPLWQIHDGERVPALAELRDEAGRWLGVSPELVGLYTWHPPVFEDALRMFVLERMQELRVHLDPRDIVTVRLAPGPGGTLMNLEPIRDDATAN